MQWIVAAWAVKQMDGYTRHKVGNVDNYTSNPDKLADKEMRTKARKKQHLMHPKFYPAKGT